MSLSVPCPELGKVGIGSDGPLDQTPVPFKELVYEGLIAVIRGRNRGDTEISTAHSGLFEGVSSALAAGNPVRSSSSPARRARVCVFRLAKFARSCAARRLLRSSSRLAWRSSAVDMALTAKTCAKMKAQEQPCAFILYMAKAAAILGRLR